jgi:hypothetical protein
LTFATSTGKVGTATIESRRENLMASWMDSCTEQELWASYGTWVDDRLGTNPGEPIATFEEWKVIERTFEDALR